MADQAFPLFARPSKSKAISIRDPDSGEMQPTPVVQQPGSTFPASLHPTTKDFNAECALNSSTNTSDSRPTQPTEDSGDDGPAFNVYARPFVPEASTVVNKLVGQVMNTQPTKRIHFGAYVGSYVGSDILSPFPVPIQPPNVSPDTISYTHYELYFRYHLEVEFQSQVRENEIYSLYGHEVTLSRDPGEPSCSFTVPGLRENSPYIEEDDLIQLRQLRYDHMGRLLGMEQWLRQGRANGFPAPGWTGMVYNGRASVVQRKKELLVLRVCGLSPPNFSMIHSVLGNPVFKFNVQFPVPKDRYLPMHQALSIVQKTLRDSNNRNLNTYAAHALYSITHPKSNSSHPLEGLSTTPLSWLQSMLFPIEADCEVQTNLNPGSFTRPFFDDQLNWEQKKAIDSVCAHNYGTLPFLISGPPGTGKTKTLAEIAVQLLKTVNEISHILFCAPSDPAADTIVQRISTHFKPTELLRLNRPSRTFAELPGAVLPFCHVLQNKFDLPPFKQLMAYKLVVTTCRDASLLLYSRLTNSDLYVAENSMRSAIHPYAAQSSEIALHWTALIMDESAQAIEPEALIPLSVVAPPLDAAKIAFTPLFVMAGDEHQ
jgi:putative helicase MOV10L1/helicase MOV-10